MDGFFLLKSRFTFTSRFAFAAKSVSAMERGGSFDCILLEQFPISPTTPSVDKQLFVSITLLPRGKGWIKPMEQKNVLSTTVWHEMVFASFFSTLFSFSLSAPRRGMYVSLVYVRRFLCGVKWFALHDKRNFRWGWWSSNTLWCSEDCVNR